MIDVKKIFKIVLPIVVLALGAAAVFELCRVGTPSTNITSPSTGV
jgi:hypothetical protein